MLGNYFTLINVSRSIHEHCVGHRISEAYSQEKQQLCIVVGSHPVRTIVVSCEPSQNYLYVHEGNFRARKNSVDLFPAAKGKGILSVACDTSDRVVLISMEDKLSLECEMFGSRANVFLWRHENTAPVASDVLVDVFLKKKELHGSRRATKDRLSPPPFHQILTDQGIFLGTMRSNHNEKILQSLKKTLPVLGSTLAREILVRANVDPSTPTSLVTDRELAKIFPEMSRIVAELTMPVQDRQARIYFYERSPLCLSLIRLRTYDEMRVETFADISTAIRRYIGMSLSASTFGDEKQKLTAWIEKEEEKAAHTRSKIALELAESDRSAAYELNGKLIMANIHRLRKGLKSASLENHLSSNEADRMAAIQLDPALTPVANAERYFEKAKKAKIAARESEERVRNLDRRLTALRALGNELGEISSSEALKEFISSNKEELKLLGFMTAKEKEDLPPFRIFNVEGGFQVLAGKSSENNDMLTTKYAKPNDLWFHCRGSSGSHVVLKVNSAPGEPSKSAIHQAASIAAYYSKMKNASSVPVVMAEKKYVRKPKGGPAGTVVLDREKVLFVEPKLPLSHSLS